jgi:transposase InsO family protein
VDSTSNMQALLATLTHAPDPNWYSDSGATHHLTSDLANLNVCADEYHGPNQIRVGNGTSLPMKHIGSTQFSTPTASFLLNNVLHVPQISKNLISVRKFTKDINTSMDFRPSCFRVQALDSGKTLLCGPSKGGLYPFPLLPSKDSFTPTALFGERTSIHQWLSRLGHPAFRVVAQIISKSGLPVTSNKSNFSCFACLSSKSKQLPFSLSSTQIQSSLELIYSDVWGNSPICSRNGNRYYISFLDAYSRYTWLFPMSHKNDALPIFINFQKYVERYFNLQIKSIQSDWGGEYRSLSKFFANCGITHRVSCPHTHQQNGAVERKHRHIVETGLALLSYASIPLRFWDDAFQTACYLINRLPQLLLKNISPFEKLFHTTPEYNFLKTFGCVCWPNLRPYNSHKLQPRSTQCVFLGYSISHKGYKCFHIPTGRTYISRDVIFLETQFPFQQTQNPTSPSTNSILGPPVGLL